MFFIEKCYILNFLANVAASKKFRAKKVYCDDQGMRLYIADHRTLGLVNDLNGHNVLKHQIIKHASNKVIEQSTPEKMQIKYDKSIFEKIKIEIKNNTPINSNKKADNKAPDKVKNKRKEVYYNADNTQSHDRIKFKSFDLILSN